MKRASPLTRADAFVAGTLSAVTIAVALYFAPRGFQEGFVDIGHDGYQLRQAIDLARGGTLFKSTFDQYGPLTGYLNTAGFLALGHRLLSIKYFVCGWYAAIAVALFLIARRWLDRGLAVFAMLVWLGLAPFYNHGIMISAHVYALLFQAIAVLLILRSPTMKAGPFVIVGVLAGLSWAVKESLGVLFVAAVAAYIVGRQWMDRGDRRRAIGLVGALFAGCALVMVCCVTFLWVRGAIHDWYLQTVVFPREFYLAGSGDAGERGPIMGAVSSVSAPFVAFVQLQLGQPLYWILIRAVVLLTAVVELHRRRLDHGLLLMALVTAFLWLGAYPSGNFMHQWWTTSLSIPVCVFCVRDLLSRWLVAERGVQWATVAVVSLAASPGIAERSAATVARASALTETLTRPAAFRGIRTDVRTKRAFELLADRMEGFRAAHPGVRVVSIETADGWSTGMVESLPLLSFLDDNTHPQPVYWSLPVLSTVVYPRYRDELWRQVADERPLIVDHRYGRVNPMRICGYQLLEVMASDFGHWYIYQPDDPKDDPGSGAACVDDDTGRFRPRVRDGIDGAYRGPFTVASHAPAPSGGTASVRLVDARQPSPSPTVDLYTWPADLTPSGIGDIQEPLSDDVAWRTNRKIIRDVSVGSWAVDGSTPSRFTYLLDWPEQELMAGTTLVMRGELHDGGLQVGFTGSGKWVGFVTVTRPGPFETELQVSETKAYALVVANCVTSPWSERARAHPIVATLGLLVGGVFPTRFEITEAGWIRPSVMAR